MTELRREPIKYLRDFLKKDYQGQGCCYICGIDQNLDLHHMYGLSELFNSWREKNSFPEVTTVKQIEEYRVLFADAEKEKLSNKYLYTLCQIHHKKLHNLYGQRYPNYKVKKILRWLDIQKDKYRNDKRV